MPCLIAPSPAGSREGLAVLANAVQRSGSGGGRLRDHGDGLALAPSPPRDRVRPGGQDQAPVPSKRSGQITTLAMSVPSSIVRNRTPLAEPGPRPAPLAGPGTADWHRQGWRGRRPDLSLPGLLPAVPAAGLPGAARISPSLMMISARSADRWCRWRATTRSPATGNR